MAIKGRRAAGRSARPSRAGTRNRKASPKRRILSPSSFRGDGPVSKTRRSIARNASKVSPKLNRELV